MVYKKDRYEKFLSDLPQYVKDIVPADAIYDCYKNGSSSARVRANLIEWAGDSISECMDEIQQAGGADAANADRWTDAAAIHAGARVRAGANDVNEKKLALHTLRLARTWRRYDAEHLVFSAAAGSGDMDNEDRVRAFFRKSKTFRRLARSGANVEPRDVNRMTRELFLKGV